MKNKYEVRGDVTAIFLNSRKYGNMETLISTSKLKRADEFPNTWCAAWSKRGKRYYVVGRISNGDDKQERLHRYVAEAPDGMDVDHKNLNTLDNTDDNLRIVTEAANQQNRAVSRRSTTGFRGVTWLKNSNRWRVRFQLGGVTKHVGYFDTLEEADEAARKARSEHMPFSQDAM